jgi:hypothetical protein
MYGERRPGRSFIDNAGAQLVSWRTVFSPQMTHRDPHKTDEACEHLFIISTSFDFLIIICFVILDGDSAINLIN